MVRNFLFSGITTPLSAAWLSRVFRMRADHSFVVMIPISAALCSASARACDWMRVRSVCATRRA